MEEKSLKRIVAHERISPNIALVKYWGKLDAEKNLPLNSSISITLNPDQIGSEICVEFEPNSYDNENLDSDPQKLHTFFLNGKPQELNDLHKQAIDFFIRDKPDIFIQNDDGCEKVLVPYSEYCSEESPWRLKITSVNNFPTAAGMASSSSGYASFACGLAKVFNYFDWRQDQSILEFIESDFVDIIEKIIKVETSANGTESNQSEIVVEEEDLRKLVKMIRFTNLVRNLSGSACRSIFKGLSFYSGPYGILKSISNGNSEEDIRKILSGANLLSEYLNQLNIRIDIPRRDWSKSLSNLEKSSLELLQRYKSTTTNPKNTLFHQMADIYFGIKTSPEDTLEIKNLLDFIGSGYPLSLLLKRSGEFDSELNNKELEIFEADLSIFIIVLDGEEKKIASKTGMIESSQTSDFLIHRVNQVDKTILKSLEAIKNRNYSELFKITMKDSNNFHSVGSDSFPPIFYLTQESKKIMRIVHSINESVFDFEKKFEQESGGSKIPLFGENSMGYTFDAGPNPFIITTKRFEKYFLSFLQENLKSEGQKIKDFWVLKNIEKQSDGRNDVDGENKEELFSKLLQSAIFDHIKLQKIEFPTDVKRVILTSSGKSKI